MRARASSACLAVALLSAPCSLLFQARYESARWEAAGSAAAEALLDAVLTGVGPGEVVAARAHARAEAAAAARARIRIWNAARRIAGVVFAASLVGFLVTRGRKARARGPAPAAVDVDALERLGFFRFLEPAARARAMAAVRAAKDPFAVSTRRLYRADAEGLAERGVRDFLGEVAPLLRHEGVPIEVTYRPVLCPATRDRPPRTERAALGDDGWLPPDGPSPAVESLRVALRQGEHPRDVVEDDEGDASTYLLYFDHEEYVVFRFEPGEAWDGWTHATRSTLRLLDALLEAHGSPERAYARFGGSNDNEVVFATPAMAAVINAAVEAHRRLEPAERVAQERRRSS